jgi:peptidoglycan hydrolase-like protein with peptidoglycan-binding domain
VTLDPHRRRRRIVLVISGAVVLLAAAVAAALSASGHGRATSRVRRPAGFSTTKVMQGRFRVETLVPGTLRLAGQRTISTARAGVVTWLPAAGRRIRLGAQLYAIDARPVFLLPGRVPAWRGFAQGMTDGPDVWQLERYLQATAYLRTLADVSFGAATTAAIKRWQRALGLPATGTLERGAVVFGTRAVKVSGHPKAVGTQVVPGDGVLGVSSGRVVVRAAVKLEDQRLARPGEAVTVMLPDGTSTPGRVTSVGVPVERADGSSRARAVVVPTTISLRRQEAARRYPRASVGVRFVSAQRGSALSVPVEALVALDDRRFGVEVPATNGSIERIPVSTGLFSAGRVEISGPAVRAGLDVVVPQR